MRPPEFARIVIDSSPLRYLHTGLGQFSLHLLQELSALPFPDAQLFALAHPRYASLIPAGISMEPVTWIRRRAPRQLQSFLYKDCKVWHMTSENTQFTGVPKGASVVLTIHGLHFLDETPPYEAEATLKKVQFLVDRAAMITVVSHFTAALVRSRLNAGGIPVKVIANGVTLKSIQSKAPAWAPRGKFLFSIGTFFPRKNFHVLIPMMTALPEYALVLAGDMQGAYGRQVQDAVRAANLETRVILPGEVNEAEKEWLFEQGEALLFPSLSEGFGIPVIEAFAHGKPAFCSRFGSLPEIGGPHATYWDDFDPATMAAIIQETMKTNTPQHAIYRKSYSERFSWKAAAISYQEVYRSLL